MINQDIKVGGKVQSGGGKNKISSGRIDELYVIWHMYIHALLARYSRYM